MPVERIKKDDYAKLHFAYHEDTDLCIVAEQLADEFGAAGSYLVWLYWPRMIARAKSAKAFGWFETTPRALAQSVGDLQDAGGWEVRARMWELLAARDVIRIRQGVVEHPAEKIDVLLVQWEKWQSLAGSEKTRLSRERKRLEEGHAVHWTVRHLDEFAFSRVTDAAFSDEKGYAVTENDLRVTQNGGRVTPLDKTRQDRKEGTRDTPASAPPSPTTPAAPPPLPSNLIEACEQAASTGPRSEWWQSSIQKLRKRNLSAPDSLYVDALDWCCVTANGQQLTTSRAWSMLRGAVTSAIKRHDESEPSSNAAMLAALTTPKPALDPDLAAMRDALMSPPGAPA